MAYDLGDTVPLSVQIRDVNGNLANAGAVVLTITLPDGTTTTPGVSNPTTGVYTVDYPPTVVGLHRVRWVATGANASAYATVFYVWDSLPAYVLSLEDVRAHLNMDPPTTAADRARDEELRTFVEAATGVVEFFCGPVVTATKTVVVRGGGPELVLPHDQVTGVTSVTPILSGSGSVAVGDLDVDPSGIVRHVSGLPISSGSLRVVYTVGRSTIPGSALAAARMIVAHLWETQRGPSRPGLLGRASIEDGQAVFLPAVGFAIPNRAMDLLKLTPTTAAGFN